MAIPACSGIPSRDTQEPCNVVPYPTRQKPIETEITCPATRAHAHARANTIPITPTRVQNNCIGDNNNYYYTRTRAREGTYDGDMAMLAEVYQDVLCRPMPRFVAAELAERMQAGAQPDMLAAILEYTGGAPRPSWAYARAVIDRQLAMGARTAAAFRAGVEQYRAARCTQTAQPGQPGQYGPKRVQEQQYSQRPYDPADDDALSPEQLAELARLAD